MSLGIHSRDPRNQIPCELVTYLGLCEAATGVDGGGSKKPNGKGKSGVQLVAPRIVVAPIQRAGPQAPGPPAQGGLAVEDDEEAADSGDDGDGLPGGDETEQDRNAM